MSDTEFTVTEASFLVDRSPTDVQNAVDKKVVKSTVVKAGPRAQRLLGRAELRFLTMDREIGEALSGVGKRRLYEELSRLPETATTARFGALVVDLRKSDAKLKKRLRLLEAIKGSIKMREGEPFIKGTDIPAYQVAALYPAASIEEILEDFPSLKRGQVEHAIDFARAYPKKGRPYPSTSLKRGISNLIKGGVFDDG
ncbi:hypothetical protein AMC87_PD00996 (plasmid) [Rhizobium phaseoli]|uniref:DUF433 domain-containing protein n=1 Tax=Rhizobium phaseoli TaxID=396 RepID=UPI0007EB5957|nr:DUF433 domain-containing protein [Rhizobium phaseoli]ANL51118.1 hypothetical protein AMC87_PD00996 [Rhizobium phaseoli]